MSKKNFYYVGKMFFLVGWLTPQPPKTPVDGVISPQGSRYPDIPERWGDEKFWVEELALDRMDFPRKKRFAKENYFW